MSFDPNPEPYVTGAAVCEFLGGVSQVTLQHYVRDGLPYKVGRNGRRRYRLSEVEAWFFESACTATPPGQTLDGEGVA